MSNEMTAEEWVLRTVRENLRSDGNPLSPRDIEQRAGWHRHTVDQREVRIAIQTLVDRGVLFYDAHLKLVLQRVAEARVEKVLRVLEGERKEMMTITLNGFALQVLTLDEAAELATAITTALEEHRKTVG